MPTKEEEVAMMTTPDVWPHTFVLPLKHKNSDGQTDNWGFMYSGVDVVAEPKIYIGNMFEIDRKMDLTKFDTICYDTFEEVVDAGWVVD